MKNGEGCSPTPEQKPSTAAQAAFNAWWKDNANGLGFHIGAQQAWALFRDGWHARGTESETAAITDNDRRWRFLEHGCQWVSWTPTGGETHSFDPRDVKYLQAMRELADKTLHEQVAQLRAEAEELERRWKK